MSKTLKISYVDHLKTIYVQTPLNYTLIKK